VNVDTGQFAALRDEVAELRGEVAELRRAVVFTTALGEAIEARGYSRGRESILGRAAVARPRHLRAVPGSAS
jgi:hypothetical protein